jgi:hypothetical protein
VHWGVQNSTNIPRPNHGIQRSLYVGTEHQSPAGENTEASNRYAKLQNSILKSLISESSPSGGSPSFKYAVNSTIIQHLVPTSSLNKSKASPPATTDASTESDAKITTSDAKSEAKSTDGKPHVGRRGMHSATGAYWNEKTDGMWSFKYEGGESKGLDVVISVIWISL